MTIATLTLKGLYVGRGNGDIRGNEYTAIEQRRPMQSPEPCNSQTPIWQQVRVTRLADIDGSIHNGDVQEFADHVGRLNYDLGEARAVGSMAVTIVGAAEMNRMIEDKYPHQSPQQAAKVRRRVADGINAFTQSAFGASFDQGTSDMAMRYATVAAAMRVCVSNELEETYVDTVDEPAWAPRGVDRHSYLPDDLLPEDVELLVTAPEEPSNVLFGNGSFDIKGVAIFGRDVAFDLSGNQILYEERHALRRHLRVEKLNTGLLDPDWKPHGSFFGYRGHVAASPITYEPDHPPMLDLLGASAVVPKKV